MRHPAAVLLSLLLSLSACATAPNRATAAPALDPPSQDWTADIARFAAEDAGRAPPAHPVVFTGSSSIRMWTSLARDFPAIAVLNRGFGGSQLRDAAWNVDALVLRYAPRRIVLYAGDNDLHAGRSPQQVLTDLRAFIVRVRERLPDVPITVLSIKPSLARVDELPRQREANALMRAAIAGWPAVEYVDIATPMLGADGLPRPELFIADGLHMTPAGYVVWTGILAPHLQRHP